MKMGDSASAESSSDSWEDVQSADTSSEESSPEVDIAYAIHDFYKELFECPNINMIMKEGETAAANEVDEASSPEFDLASIPKQVLAPHINVASSLQVPGSPEANSSPYCNLLECLPKSGDHPSGCEATTAVHNWLKERITFRNDEEKDRAIAKSWMPLFVLSVPDDVDMERLVSFGKVVTIYGWVQERHLPYLWFRDIDWNKETPDLDGIEDANERATRQALQDVFSNVLGTDATSREELKKHYLEEFGPYKSHKFFLATSLRLAAKIYGKKTREELTMDGILYNYFVYVRSLYYHMIEMEGREDFDEEIALSCFWPSYLCKQETFPHVLFLLDAYKSSFEGRAAQILNEENKDAEHGDQTEENEETKYLRILSRLTHAVFHHSTLTCNKFKEKCCVKRHFNYQFMSLEERLAMCNLNAAAGTS